MSPNINRDIKSRRIRWAWHAARMEKVRNIHNILAGTEKPLGKPRRQWEDNIRMDLRQIGWEIVGWMHLAQDRDQ
jgi:hypothetical protein